MPRLDAIKQAILTECADDFVGLWSVIRDVERHLGTSDESAIRTTTFDILDEMLRDRQIVAGFPEEGGFRILSLPVKQILELVDREWKADKRPTIGEGVWFTSSQIPVRM